MSLLTLTALPVAAQNTGPARRPGSVSQVPSGRVVVERAPLQPGPGRPAYATLLPGQPVHILSPQKAGQTRVQIRTVGPIELQGFVTARQLGLCAREQAAVRRNPDQDPIGYVPRGWCFRVLDNRDNHVQLVAPRFGLTVYVAARDLTATPNPAHRMDPALSGFRPHRTVAEPLRLNPKAAPYFTVPAGQWPLRAGLTQGNNTRFEVLGEAIALIGWKPTTRLFADLFERRDEVTLARQRLASRQRPAPDPRPWYRLRTRARLYLRPNAAPAGEAAANVQVTLGRRAGAWQQIRFEERDARGRPTGLITAQLWVDAKALQRIKSPFSR